MVKNEMRIQLTGADNPTLLGMFSESGITVSQLKIHDEITAEMVIRDTDYHLAAKLAEKRGAELRILRKQGILSLVRMALKRPVLVVGAAILLALTVFLPTRILFFRVEGNQFVPSRQILEKASACGISFGASRREVRSEKMKNALLEAMPQLQWAGVNTQGCVAVISVKERDMTQQQGQTPSVSSIVAVRDAVVESVTVTKGTAACTPGSAVTAGQLLISGYTDCGLTIRADRAQGEIFGRSQRQLEVLYPQASSARQTLLREETSYCLIVGKNQINFCKDSGISDTTCDRMYVEYYVTLPGGFRLPFAVAKETRLYYESVPETPSAEDAAALLRDFADGYLTGQMVAGQILSKEETVTESEGIFRLIGNYACREMIGREQQEEIITPYGKHD